MVGGSLALRHALDEATGLWARLARGYKAGGFNPSLAAYPDFSAKIHYGPEYLWSVEAGARYAPPGDAFTGDLTVFWQRREDLQIEIPLQVVPNDPTAFVFYTENARRGRTWGAELALGWQALPSLELHASLGLLRTEITEFPEQTALEGRDLAHAPRYTHAVGAAWRNATGWFLRADLGGRDRFYIDYCQEPGCNDPRLPGYSVLDLRAGREWGKWTVTAWVRNALDEEYATRGFYFGNEPPAFAPTLYTRLGDPRHAGLTVSFDW
jgi:outer membrane receptor protein involved in Fe transport